MTLEYVLAQRSKQSTTWIAQVPNIIDYIYINAKTLEKLKNKPLLRHLIMCAA